jgi:hypothetical protein
MLTITPGHAFCACWTHCITKARVKFLLGLDGRPQQFLAAELQPVPVAVALGLGEVGSTCAR